MSLTGLDLTQLGRMMDISTVRADSTAEEVEQMITIVKTCRCICASPMPYATPYVVRQLADTPGTVVTGVVSFPSGAEATETKVHMAKELIGMGCRELDMVINVGALKSGRMDYVRQDIQAVVEAAGDVPVKTILEICYLTDDEIARASLLAVEAGAAFIKTGTGWGPRPTTVDTVRLIRRVIGSAAKIKSAGGVRDLDILLDLLEAGCDRFGVGVRSAAAIFEEAYRRAGQPLPLLLEPATQAG